MIVSIVKWEARTTATMGTLDHRDNLMGLREFQEKRRGMSGEKGNGAAIYDTHLLFPGWDTNSQKLHSRQIALLGLNNKYRKMDST